MHTHHLFPIWHDDYILSSKVSKTGSPFPPCSTNWEGDEQADTSYPLFHLSEHWCLIGLLKEVLVEAGMWETTDVGWLSIMMLDLCMCTSLARASFYRDERVKLLAPSRARHNSQRQMWHDKDRHSPAAMPYVGVMPFIYINKNGSENVRVHTHFGKSLDTWSCGSAKKHRSVFKV